MSCRSHKKVSRLGVASASLMSHVPVDDMRVKLRSALGSNCLCQVQIAHGRRPNVKLQTSSGSVFNRSKSLQVIATRGLAPGERLCLDYAPEKLESQARSRLAPDISDVIVARLWPDCVTQMHRNLRYLYVYRSSARVRWVRRQGVGAECAGVYVFAVCRWH